MVALAFCACMKGPPQTLPWGGGCGVAGFSHWGATYRNEGLGSSICRGTCRFLWPTFIGTVQHSLRRTIGLAGVVPLNLRCSATGAQESSRPAVLRSSQIQFFCNIKRQRGKVQICDCVVRIVLRRGTRGINSVSLYFLSKRQCYPER